MVLKIHGREKQDMDYKTRHVLQNKTQISNNGWFYEIKAFEEIFWDFIYEIHENREIWIYRFKQNIGKTFIKIFSSQIFYDNGEALLKVT